MPRGERIPPEVIGQIELMSAEGKTSPQICETLGVSTSTVSRVRNKMKEKSPAAVTADAGASTENASITDIPIITDNAENVKRNPSAVTQEDIPGIVRETIAREIDDLVDEIGILRARLEELETNKTELEKWYLGTAPHIAYREVKNGT